MTITNSRLPKYVGWGAFAIYLITLSHGVTMNNLVWTAQVTGWDPQPLGSHPVLWLLTLPLRWLPAGWVPLELNIFSALCGAWTLSHLARSVQILPQNRTPVQRIFLTSNRGLYLGVDNWAPAVLAAVICGLEFNFWQQSVAAVGETLNILLFAAALRWLLEYRTDRNPRYLRKAIFLWGVGMTESWNMILLLPLFIGGIMWLRGRRFYSPRFLLGAALTGLAGFSLYLIPPVLNSLSTFSELSFHDAWLGALRDTKQSLTNMQTMFWSVRKDLGGLLLACFILPLLPSLIRVSSDGAYQKSLVEKIQILFHHISHLIILVACLWVALDPFLGPRRTLESQLSLTYPQLELSWPLLMFDYLVALGAGYIAGYFLVIFGGSYKRLFRRKTGKHRPPFAPRWLRQTTPVVIQSLPVAMAMLLCLRNLAPIIALNDHPLREFGELAASSLPPNGSGIVLCDDPMRGVVLRSAMSKAENERWQVVNVPRLISPGYRARLEHEHSRNWVTPATQSNLGLVDMLRLLDRIVRNNQVFYLHPAQGYFFDAFYLEPRGAVYHLKSYAETYGETLADNNINPPPLNGESIEAGEKFWESAWRKTIVGTAEVLARHPRDFLDTFFLGLKTEKPKNDQARLLGQWYSMDLNHWGVTLQQLQQMPTAQRRFEQALDCATNNRAALFNLVCNTNLQAGLKLNLGSVSTLFSALRSRQQLNSLLERYGPFDEPNFCYALGVAYSQAGLYRQAIQVYERAFTLAPDAVASGFALAHLYSKRGLHEALDNTIKKIRENPNASNVFTPLNDTEITVLEAKSWAVRTNLARASELLEALGRRHPDSATVRELVAQSYLENGDSTNALRYVNERVANNPKDIDALTTQSVVFMMMNRAEQAIPVLDRILTMTNSPKARLNRAIAYAQVGKLNEAEADYKLVQNYPEGAYQLHYGLAEIAMKRRDTNAAIQHLELCVLYAKPGSLQMQDAKSFLKFYKRE